MEPQHEFSSVRGEDGPFHLQTSVEPEGNSGGVSQMAYETFKGKAKRQNELAIIQADILQGDAAYPN